MTRSITVHNVRFNWGQVPGPIHPPPKPEPPPIEVGERLRLTAQQTEVTEGRPAVFRIGHDGAMDADCSCTWTVSSSGVTADDLVSATSARVDFPVGTDVVNVTVATLARAGDGGNRLATLTLSNPTSGASFARTAATSTIHEVGYVAPTPTGTSTIGVSVRTPIVREGEPIILHFLATGANTVARSCTWTLTTATNSDLNLGLIGVRSGTITFPIGSNATIERVVTTLTPGSISGSRVVTCNLTAQSPGTVVFSPANGTATLTDATVGEILTPTSLDSDVFEGEDLTFKIVRSGDKSVAAGCRWTLTSANGPLDLAPAYSGRVTIPAATATLDLSVGTVDQPGTQNDRTITMELSDPLGCEFATGYTTATTLLHDKVADVEQLRAVARIADVTENSPAQFRITHDGSMAASCQVRWTVTSTGTLANNALDLGTPRQATITINADEVFRNIDVATLDRLDAQGDRTLTMTLDQAVGCTLVTPTATMTLHDREPAIVGARLRIAPVSTAVVEGQEITVRVFRDGDRNVACSCGFTWASSRNAADLPATGLTGTVNFPVDIMQKDLQITTQDVANAQGERQITCTIRDPVSCTLKTGERVASVTLDDPAARGSFPSGLPWRSGMTIGGYDRRLWWDGQTESSSMARWRHRPFDTVLIYNANHGNSPARRAATATAQWNSLVGNNCNSSGGYVAQALSIGMQPFFASTLLPWHEKGRFDLIHSGQRDNYLEAIADELASWLKLRNASTPAVICCPGQENTGGYGWSLEAAHQEGRTLTVIDYVKAYKRWARIMDVRINVNGRSRTPHATRNARMYFAFNCMRNWWDTGKQGGTPYEYNPNRTNFTWNDATRYYNGFDLLTYQPCDYWTLDCYDHTGPKLDSATAAENWMGSYRTDLPAPYNRTMNTLRSCAKFAEEHNMSFGIQEWFHGVERLAPYDGTTQVDPSDYRNYIWYVRAMWKEFGILTGRQYNPNGDTPYIECGFNQTTDRLGHDFWPNPGSGYEGAAFAHLQLPSAEYQRLWTPGNGEGQRP